MNDTFEVNIVGSCGSTVYAEDSYVCPYFSRKEEWGRMHGNTGPCGVDLQCGTNRCLYAVLKLGLAADDDLIVIDPDDKTANPNRKTAKEAWEEFKRHYMPVELTPSFHGKDCLGNGEHPGIEWLGPQP